MSSSPFLVPARRPRRPWRLVLLLLLIPVLVVPTVALATDGFPDVGDGPHHDNVTAIADAEITQGFPDGTYRPSESVRRDQMASFMARLGGLGDNPPVADAATLDGRTAADLEPQVTVRTAEFTITADDWGNNLHYGSSNIYRAYTIPPEATHGIPLNEAFDAGSAITASVNAHHEGGGSLGSWHQLPFLYESVDGIGVKVVLFLSRGQMAITQTTTGWDHNSISAEHLPDELEVRLAFIENLDG